MVPSTCFIQKLQLFDNLSLIMFPLVCCECHQMNDNFFFFFAHEEYEVTALHALKNIHRMSRETNLDVGL